MMNFSTASATFLNGTSGNVTTTAPWLEVEEPLIAEAFIQTFVPLEEPSFEYFVPDIAIPELLLTEPPKTITQQPPTEKTEDIQGFIPHFVPIPASSSSSPLSTPGSTSTHGATNFNSTASRFITNFSPTVSSTIMTEVNNATFTARNMSFPTTGKFDPEVNNATFTARNMSFPTTGKFDRAFYGFPAFCSNAAPVSCANEILSHCQECNMASAGFFIFVVVALALAIILSNALVVIVFAKNKSTFTGSYGKIKASLAVADMLTGVLLLIVALPNISKTLNSTANELLQYAISLQGSPLALAGGVFYIFIYTSSLYHLVFLGQQRLYAIRWPISYKQQPLRNTYIGLAVVWSFALLCAVCPLWFPNVFSFGYQHLIFLFNLTLTQVSRTPDFSSLIAMMVVVFVVPYVVMTILSVLTGCYVARHLKKSSKMKSTSSARNREVMVFTTLAAMQICFTITLVPLIVVVVMSYAGALNTSNIAAPYVICFYISMSNSLANVLVYSVVDKKFRNSVRELFCACCPKALREKTESTAGSSGVKKTQSTLFNKSKEVSKSSQADTV